MSTPRLVGGIIAALLAVFAGGCGLIYFFAGAMTLLEGKVDYGVTMFSVVIGVVPGAILGYIAWRCLRKPPAEQGGGT